MSDDPHAGLEYDDYGASLPTEPMSETPTQSEQIVALAEAVRLLAWHLGELHIYMNQDAEGRAEMKAVRDNMIELMKNASLGRSGRMGSDESTGMATNMLTPGDENPLVQGGPAGAASFTAALRSEADRIEQTTREGFDLAHGAVSVDWLVDRLRTIAEQWEREGVGR